MEYNRLFSRCVLKAVGNNFWYLVAGLVKTKRIYTKSLQNLPKTTLADVSRNADEFSSTASSKLEKGYKFFVKKTICLTTKVSPLCYVMLC